MKKVRLQNNMRIIGIRNFRGGAKRIDYFLITPGNEKLYAFSCTYTHKSYDEFSGVKTPPFRRSGNRESGSWKP